ncbi:MAG TPA: sulfatase-like hydrolase/transferase [Solirubrobacteraceae bacterium]|nr:sulfatase-like hydrolase/transferase [Solirubrobacteraceae bacterium]
MGLSFHRSHRARRALAIALFACACVGVAACGGGSHKKPSVSATTPPHVGGTPPTATRPFRGRPNIVFVLTDDLSSNLVRFMPHVLAMERHGLTFKNYFVSDSLCCPSRASIFTGNFPHDTHVYGNFGTRGGFQAFHRRGEERHTFAVALRRAGYRTAMMGKYLNGYAQVVGQGHVADGEATDVPPTYVPPGWNEWDVAGWGYPEFNYTLNEDGVLHRFGHKPNDYLTDVIARKGVQFIDGAARRHQPFFLELATFAPHSPYTPAPVDKHDFAGLKAPRPPNFDVLPTDPPQWLAPHPPLTRKRLARINWAFRRRVQAVQAVDRMIGQIELTLSSDGLSGSTYLVFSSDNGLHTGEYRLMPGKLTAFDTDIRVPLVVSGPGVKSDSTTPKMAENVDLARTFTALGGTRLAGDGHSLKSLFEGHRAPQWRNAVLIEHESPPLRVKDPDYQQPASGSPTTYEAMRTNSFLYVEYADGEREFYDLRADPFELHNIAASLTQRRLSRLHAELSALRGCHGSKSCWKAMHVKK